MLKHAESKETIASRFIREKAEWHLVAKEEPIDRMEEDRVT